MTETVFTNAQIVLEDETIRGSIAFDANGIRAVDSGRSTLPGAIDVDGHYIVPGLVEMHTDNAEKHFVPRPGVFWPDGLAAMLAHDAQMAAAGVTTVYDSICAGSVYGGKDFRNEIFPQVINALTEGVETRAFRIDHKLHIRCELTSDSLTPEIAPFADHPLLALISFMDHTPGQRQWRNMADLERYVVGSGEKSLEQHRRDVEVRIEISRVNKDRNLPEALALFAGKPIVIASHDDTTEADVAEALSYGARISEFPTTLEAARAAHQSGLATIAGAPNVVRGGSHSSNVAAGELAEAGVLDGLSSDYVPSSLLQAVHVLTRKHGLSLPQAVGMVTWRVADMVGLADRGRVTPGLRADLTRFSIVGDTPVVHEVYCAGKRVC